MFLNRYPYTDFHELNLDWVLQHFSDFDGKLDDLESWKVSHEAEYEQLKALYDDIISGRFPESMTDALYEWTVENSSEIIGDQIATVFFEITDSGYFAAYVPDSWTELTFGTTGLDTNVPGVDYGHLTISY